MEVHDIIQEAGVKTIPKEKKFKKAKWLSEEALQIAVKRREMKGKGEKERYTHLNAEFQRIARRDKWESALSSFRFPHSKHPSPTTKEETLNMDITRLLIQKSN